MRSPRFWIVVTALHLLGFALILYGLPLLIGYTTKGSLDLPGLKNPVKVLRDEKGMAYLYAKSLDDATAAQGFVTAQDRLFQMQLTRMVAQGRISELAGEKGKWLDVRMRTIGIHRIAEAHAKILDEETRSYFQRYIDGVNAFIRESPGDHHLEFKIAGIKPEPWTIVDSLSILYFMAWTNSANAKDEIATQMIIDKVGIAKAREIFPLNINPDDPQAGTKKSEAALQDGMRLQVSKDAELVSYVRDRGLRIGSNNWAVSPKLSQSGKPIVADDPHLDSRILPGVWYTVGLITPRMRAVGAMIPGIPGLVVGRSDKIAVGVTNSYGDSQDLYVETVDPKDAKRYMEGDASVPFTIVKETIKIKDKNAPSGFRSEELIIRHTKRGPIISGAFKGLSAEKLISLRWAAWETMQPKIGIKRMLESRSVKDLREAIKLFTMMTLNFVYGDVDGNIEWRASGKLPIRSQKDGTYPFVVKDSQDNWTGWIPFAEMPHSENPERGWLGTCNHYTVQGDYPYYYSSSAASSYRYRRLKQLLGSPGPKSADNHWRYQRDVVNLLAEKIAPIMAQALIADERTEPMGRILEAWKYRDDKDAAAPAIFEAVYLTFVRLVMEDELGHQATAILLDRWYLWQERIAAMVLDGTSPWFDNVNTKEVRESRDDLFRQAARKAMILYGPQLGDDPRDWVWGKVHRIEFVNPLRREGIGKSILGGGSYPMSGSGQTLYRAFYRFSDPFMVVAAASLRMVADLGDSEKVLGVISGGISGRTFHQHHKDQIEPWLRGDKVYWWFSDKAIREHCSTTLVLNPVQ